MEVILLSLGYALVLKFRFALRLGEFVAKVEASCGLKLLASLRQRVKIIWKPGSRALLLRLGNLLDDV